MLAFIYSSFVESEALFKHVLGLNALEPVVMLISELVSMPLFYESKWILLLA